MKYVDVDVRATLAQVDSGKKCLRGWKSVPIRKGVAVGKNKLIVNACVLKP